MSRKLVKMQAELQRFESGQESQPQKYLGWKELEGSWQLLVWRPGSESLQAFYQGDQIQGKKIHPSGLFVFEFPGDVITSEVLVQQLNGTFTREPYTFSQSLTDMEIYLFNKGVHYKIFQTLGAQFITHEGVKGVRFAVWAPNAKAVMLVGDLNGWNIRSHPMCSLGGAGIYELFVPEASEGANYKFLIKDSQNYEHYKADPYAFYTEMRPHTASIVTRRDCFTWTDDYWMRRRGELNAPINVYEVHLGSWKKLGEEFPNYRNLGRELASYCKELGYTHVELLPVMEHPLDESWGYQVTGFYSITSRYGTLQDFKWFVNHLHQQGIGVILDWVPGHFPTDHNAFGRFDGTALYEHEDPRKGLHPDWNTLIFNYGRIEVSNFLIGSALYWLDELHVDGLRVDGVASMLYLDYGRMGGDWIPNKYGEKENLEAIEFIKHLNCIVKSRFPSAWMIAEESTIFPNVTKPAEEGGLGFTMKWNMGWMNDSLRFFQRPFNQRPGTYYDSITSYHYAFCERFMLTLSHDEVVHCKKSLLHKMPGYDHQKLANLRLLLSCMMCHPGKKLLFMGGEWGQEGEWDCKKQLEWENLKDPRHAELHEFVKEMNHLYLRTPALWEKDFTPFTHQWIVECDGEKGVVVYLRKGEKQQILCLHNFSDQYYSNYTFHFSSGPLALLLSTEKGFTPELSRNEGNVTLSIPALTTLIFEVLE